MKNIKILHLIYDHLNNPWVGGGGAVRVYEIYKRLAQKGHDITIISGNYSGAKDYEEEGISFKFLGVKNNYILSTFSYAYFANKFLSKNYKSYEVIIEDFAPWNPIFSFRYQHKKSIILQIQNYLGKEILKKFLLLGIPFYFVEKEYPKKFKNIIVVSESLKKRFNLIKASVIPNGIEKVYETITAGNYIGFIGRIDVRQKGLDLIIKVFKELKDLNLTIAGDGKDKKRFLNMINNLTNIDYIGKVKHKAKENFFKDSKFLIMPSRFEGQGIVALEAAAMGKPLIVSDIPELSYVTENGFGISFRSGDANSLKKAIEYLWNNEKLILQMGEKGRQYAKQFTWDRIAEEYENYLLKIADLV